MKRRGKAKAACGDERGEPKRGKKESIHIVVRQVCGQGFAREFGKNAWGRQGQIGFCNLKFMRVDPCICCRLRSDMENMADLALYL